MKRRGSGLAARFRSAASREAERKTEAEQAAEQQLEQDRRERDLLFDDLAALGHELPIDGVERTDDGVRMRNGDQVLSFGIAEGASVTVDYTGRPDSDVHTVFRQHELGGRWVWKRVRRGREARLPLFDQALEILLVHGLGLPEPEQESTAPEPADEPAQDAAPTGSKKHL